MNKLTLLLLVFATALLAQPQIFIATPEYDWGNIKAEETTLEHTFIIKNTGSDTLRITRVKPGCSCTVVEFNNTIAPGETGSLKAGLKIHKNSSKQSKGITVYSNDPKNESLRLHLKANPLAPVNLDKKFSQFNANVPIADTLKITSTMKTFKINRINYKERVQGDSSSSATSIDAIDFTLLSSDKKPDALGFYSFIYVMNFSINTDRRQSGTITIETNQPQKRTIEKRCFVDLPQTSNQ